ncbi:MAG: penicillin-binding protein 2 [Candidatus Omnitrophota bacterium]
MRIKVFRILLAGLFIFLALFLFHLQALNGRKYAQLSDSNRVRIIPQQGSRGSILDRNGEVIVGNHLSYNVSIIPRQVRNSDETLRKLSGYLGMPFEKLKVSYFRGKGPSFLPVTVARDIDKRKAILIEEAKASLPGAIIEQVPERFYPNNKLACHLLGYLSEIDHWRLTKLKDYGYKTKDVVGYSGIEERYDYYLRQEEGGLQVEIDYRGNITRILGLRSPKNGKDVQLTIDLNIQKVIEECLGERRGAVVVLDPYSGEVLGMASAPGFDPGSFLSKAASRDKVFTDPKAPLLNRAISATYPLGSVFKVVIASGALEADKIEASSTYHCSGSVMIGRREYNCAHVHGDQNVKQALAHSCNVFFYKAGILLGPEKIYEWANKFGLGKPTQIDLPSENSGYVPNPFWRRLNKLKGSWFDGDTANLAIGQGELLVSPIQAAVLMAAIANSGVLVKPYLISSVDGKDISRYQRKTSTVAIHESTMRLIRKGLKGAVEDSGGTANVIASTGVAAAGKTGTAQTQAGKPAHAWFAGFFPYEDPKYTICVFLEYGGSSVIACQVTRDIIEGMKVKGLL